MNTLFLLQFACCIIMSMLGLILVLSRFQIRWSNRRYEVSRWLLAFSMFVLAGHYVLQMLYGFRAKKLIMAKQKATSKKRNVRVDAIGQLHVHTQPRLESNYSL